MRSNRNIWYINWIDLWPKSHLLHCFYRRLRLNSSFRFSAAQLLPLELHRRVVCRTKHGSQIIFPGCFATRDLKVHLHVMQILSKEGQKQIKCTQIVKKCTENVGNLQLWQTLLLGSVKIWIQGCSFFPAFSMQNFLHSESAILCDWTLKETVLFAQKFTTV